MLGLGLSIPQLAVRGLRLTDLAAAIRALFAAGEQGVWYDPSDLTTLFQDAAGTIPVTAVEQPVGLMLDKSKGLVLGSELVTNGTFDTDTNWTKGAGWSISAGTANLAGTAGTFPTISQNYAYTANSWYRVTFTVSNYAGGVVQFTSRPGGQKGPQGSANGTYSFYFLASGTDTYFGIQDQNGGAVLSIDNVSVKQFAGNHATQTTSTSRPVLRARVNLLTKTEQFDDAVWTKSLSTISANANVAPDGTTTADKFVETANSGAHQMWQLLSAEAGRQYTLSTFVRAGERTRIGIGPGNTAVGSSDRITYFLLTGSGSITSQDPFVSSAAITRDGDYYRISCTFTATTSGAMTCVTRMTDADGNASYTGDGTSGLYIWGASLVTTNQAHLPYQRVNTATDYDTAGFPHYLRFDGVDDSLVTNSINFTATDKMTVFAGVRKLSDASLGCVAGTFSSGSAGVFELLAPRVGPGEKYGFLSSGTIPAVAITSNAAFNAPATNVLTGIGNISGDQAILRANGVQVGSSTDNQGTGNYGNYSLHLGVRPSSAFPFAGHLYQLVVRGAQSTDQQIIDAEKYVNDKTRAYA